MLKLRTKPRAQRGVKQKEQQANWRTLGRSFSSGPLSFHQLNANFPHFFFHSIDFRSPSPEPDTSPYTSFLLLSSLSHWVGGGMWSTRIRRCWHASFSSSRPDRRHISHTVYLAQGSLAVPHCCKPHMFGLAQVFLFFLFIFLFSSPLPYVSFFTLTQCGGWRRGIRFKRVFKGQPVNDLLGLRQVARSIAPCCCYSPCCDGVWLLHTWRLWATTGISKVIARKVQTWKWEAYGWLSLHTIAPTSHPQDF